MTTIILTGGGTAGHVTPALALLPELREYFDRIAFIGGDGPEGELARRAGLEFYRVPTAGLVRGSIIKNIKLPFTFLRGVAEAKKLLKALRPSVVFSKGGYAALPAVVAAAKLKIPVVAHESDRSLGLSNKIAAKYGATVLTAYPSTAEANPDFSCVGLPVRAELRRGSKGRAVRELDLDVAKRTLLVTGGSSGSTALNAVVLSALPTLLKTYNVVHITGKKNKISYIEKGYYPLEYSYRIEDLYAAADVVVSRAGAGAVSELGYLKKSAVLIPLPTGASRGDQLQNAEEAEKNGAVVLQQEQLTADTLLAAIDKARGKKMSAVAPVANAAIASILANAAGAERVREASV